MAQNIYQALKRLDLTTWDPRAVKKFQENISRRDLYETVLTVERIEGERNKQEKSLSPQFRMAWMI